MEIQYLNKSLYYEVHGEGKPLLILNGIMMSHLSWKPFLEDLAKDRKVILFDFFDQGKSAKLEGLDYSHEVQVDAIKELMKNLNLTKTSIMGISYGAQIALQYAIKYPDDVDKLLVFNAASYTTPWLRDIGRAWVGAAKTLDPMHFFHVTIPYIYSNTFYTRNIEWVENRKELLKGVFQKPFLDAMVRLINSSESFDIRSELNKIKANTLVVGADCDYITPPNESKELATLINNSRYIEISECGHASMYERPNEFILLINGFLTSSQKINIVQR